MPRWALILAAIVAVIWLLSDPGGFADTIKGFVGAIITFAKELSS
jgi:hypothetical protein